MVHAVAEIMPRSVLLICEIMIIYYFCPLGDHILIVGIGLIEKLNKNQLNSLSRRRRRRRRAHWAGMVTKGFTEKGRHA